MNNICKTNRLLTTVVLSLLILPIQNALADHEIIFTQEGGFGCQTATFEGGVHREPIHPENGGLIPGSVFRFAADWELLTAGAYANNPSGIAVVQISFSANSAEILFEDPVDEVGFSYVSVVPVTLTAYDAASVLVDSVSAPVNGPPLAIWDPLMVTSGSQNIVRVVVDGVDGGTALDDLKVCGLITPDVQINNLVADVMNLNLQKGISNSIDSKLDRALQALDDTNQNNDVAAVNALQAFVNSVNAQRGNQISEGDAVTLIAAAQAIIDQLSP